MKRLASFLAEADAKTTQIVMLTSEGPEGRVRRVICSFLERSKANGIANYTPVSCLGHYNEEEERARLVFL